MIALHRRKVFPRLLKEVRQQETAVGTCKTRQNDSRRPFGCQIGWNMAICLGEVIHVRQETTGQGRAGQQVKTKTGLKKKKNTRKRAQEEITETNDRDHDSIVKLRMNLTTTNRETRLPAHPPAALAGAAAVVDSGGLLFQVSKRLCPPSSSGRRAPALTAEAPPPAQPLHGLPLPLLSLPLPPESLRASWWVVQNYRTGRSNQ